MKRSKHLSEKQNATKFQNVKKIFLLIIHTQNVHANEGDNSKINFLHFINFFFSIYGKKSKKITN